jgi:transcriptional regulator with XRE-family HTH domain
MTQGTSREPQETVGQRIRRLRLAKGLSQRQLASGGTGEAYISLVERGKRKPSLRVLRHFAGRLGVDVEYLESGRSIPPSKERGLRLADAELELRLSHDLDRAASVLRELLAEDVRDGLEGRIRSALGAVAARRGDYPETIRQLEAVIAAGAAAPEAQPDTYEVLGRAYLATGASPMAITLLQSCVAAVDQDERFRPLQVRYRRFLAEAFSALGAVDRATTILDEAARRAEEAGGLADQVGVHWERARLLWSQGDGDGALEALTYARALAEHREDTLESARASVCAAQILNYAGRHDEARPHLERARHLLRFGDAAPDEGLLLAEEAKVLARSGDPERALALAQAADGLLAGHVRHVPNAAHALAVAHAELGDIEAADVEYRRAFDALAARRQSRELAAVAHDWAMALRRAGEADRAFAVLEELTARAYTTAAATSREPGS